MIKTFTIDTDIAEKIIKQFRETLELKLLETKAHASLERKYLEQLLQLDVKSLKEILEASFYASLEKEEGKSHHFSLIVSPPKSIVSSSVSEKEAEYIFSQVYSFEESPDINHYLHKLA